MGVLSFREHTACIEGEMYNIALDCLGRIVYCDLNGLYALIDGNKYLHIPKIGPYEESEFTIPPKVLYDLNSCIEKLGIKENEIPEKILSIFSSIEIPFLFFTQKECAGIVTLEILNDPEHLKEIYKMASRRFELSELKAKICQGMDDYYLHTHGMTSEKYNKIIAKAKSELH